LPIRSSGLVPGIPNRIAHFALDSPRKEDVCGSGSLTARSNTAKVFGLSFPPGLLAIADEVIE
jgi:hypothetical protein